MEYILLGYQSVLCFVVKVFLNYCEGTVQKLGYVSVSFTYFHNELLCLPSDVPLFILRGIRGVFLACVIGTSSFYYLTSSSSTYFTH